MGKPTASVKEVPTGRTFFSTELVCLAPRWEALLCCWKWITQQTGDEVQPLPAACKVACCYRGKFVFSFAENALGIANAKVKIQLQWQAIKAVAVRSDCSI